MVLYGKLPCSKCVNKDLIEICFGWKNLRPMFSLENNSKNDTWDENLYILQINKAEQFLD